MLTFNYKERISAREALNDIWFKNAPNKPIDCKIISDSLSNLKNFNAT